jgi:uncharacterized protein (DUF1919 family)
MLIVTINKLKLGKLGLYGRAIKDVKIRFIHNHTMNTNTNETITAKIKIKNEMLYYFLTTNEKTTKICDTTLL